MCISDLFPLPFSGPAAGGTWTPTAARRCGGGTGAGSGPGSSVRYRSTSLHSPPRSVLCSFRRSCFRLNRTAVPSRPAFCRGAASRLQPCSESPTRNLKIDLIGSSCRGSRAHPHRPSRPRATRSQALRAVHTDRRHSSVRAASVSPPSTASHWHHRGWSWECVRGPGCTGPAMPPPTPTVTVLRVTPAYGNSESLPSLAPSARPSGSAAFQCPARLDSRVQCRASG
jgi:hypothetical protein